MEYHNYVKKRLQELKVSDIVFTEYANERIALRDLSKSEIRDNLLFPERLVFAIKQKSLDPCEEKFDCYFHHGETKHHRYILILNKKCVVLTAMERFRSLNYLRGKKR